jgi:hypothetical protein
VPSVSSSFGSDGTLRSTLTREGLDIGPKPDFFADLEKLRKLLPGPAPTAPTPGAQAQVLRAPAPRQVGTERASNAYRGPDYTNATPRSFARPSMSPQGVMGYYLNPLDVPMALQGQMPTGFFTDDTTSNYTYSPTVNPARYATGQTQRERPR